MANEIKITKKMKRSAIANLISDLAKKDEKLVLENGITPEMIIEYCNKEIESLNKKNASKSESKKDKEKKEKDSALKQAILESLAVGKKYSCIDIRNACSEVSDYVAISGSKLTYLLTSMVNEDKTLIREVIKRTPHFYLANATENKVES